MLVMLVDSLIMRLVNERYRIIALPSIIDFIPFYYSRFREANKGRSLIIYVSNI